MCQAEYMNQFGITRAGGDKKLCYVCLINEKIENDAKERNSPTSETEVPEVPDLPVDNLTPPKVPQVLVTENPDPPVIEKQTDQQNKQPKDDKRADRKKRHR